MLKYEQGTETNLLTNTNNSSNPLNFTSLMDLKRTDHSSLDASHMIKVASNKQIKKNNLNLKK